MLWGVVYHGYQCTLCEINIHRYHCIGEVTAECAGQGRRTIKLRKSSQHKNVNRKSRIAKYFHITFNFIFYSPIVAVTPEEKDGIDSCPIPRREDEEEVSGCGLTGGGTMFYLCKAYEIPLYILHLQSPFYSIDTAASRFS